MLLPFISTCKAFCKVLRVKGITFRMRGVGWIRRPLQKHISAPCPQRIYSRLRKPGKHTSLGENYATLKGWDKC